MKLQSLESTSCIISSCMNSGRTRCCFHASSACFWFLEWVVGVEGGAAQVENDQNLSHTF